MPLHTLHHQSPPLQYIRTAGEQSRRNWIETGEQNGGYNDEPTAVAAEAKPRTRWRSCDDYYKQLRGPPGRRRGGVDSSSGGLAAQMMATGNVKVADGGSRDQEVTPHIDPTTHHRVIAPCRSPCRCRSRATAGTTSLPDHTAAGVAPPTASLLLTVGRHRLPHRRATTFW
ncbi:hypothetical protein Syun_030576 [Stephania yunnanensis]|uniref:Uncharacterized protein n=1 Tax=Stephania yunnanensis TaxID=152371 RepID=A0AAP0DXM2_9MAGN